jgi:hypothetical protein
LCFGVGTFFQGSTVPLHRFQGFAFDLGALDGAVLLGVGPRKFGRWGGGWLLREEIFTRVMKYFNLGCNPIGYLELYFVYEY